MNASCCLELSAGVQRRRCIIRGLDYDCQCDLSMIRPSIMQLRLRWRSEYSRVVRLRDMCVLPLVEG